ncbi:hypothetical protein GCM10027598_48000 [Amycolatopsis oliviviridis]|uniref:Uncharacterized protein n=2 Tax=Amycolatopsis oliviviridis TaxID=1471590 RepID=A0ABQ3MDD6_9PSEU|nr:hypothetical protein GCM10017790_82840 [Amycolatopsis oliviviridis]
MGKIRKSTRTRGRLLATAAILALLAPLGIGTAQAGLMSYQDGYEFNPSAKWSIAGSHSSGGGFNINIPSSARTGNNSGWLGVQPGGWAYQQIEIPTGSVSGRPDTECAAAIWIKPMVIRQEVAIEIWDRNGNQLYRRLSEHAGSENYQQIYTDRWTLGSRTSVFVRIVDYGTTGQGGTIRLDDLVFQCYFIG